MSWAHKGFGKILGIIPACAESGYLLYYLAGLFSDTRKTCIQSNVFPGCIFIKSPMQIVLISFENIVFSFYNQHETLYCIQLRLGSFYII
jgi:hypothetical protein